MIESVAQSTGIKLTSFTLVEHNITFEKLAKFKDLSVYVKTEFVPYVTISSTI